MRAVCAAALLCLAAAAAAPAGRAADTFPVAGWSLIRTGADGGTIWAGRIPTTVVADRRASAVYLPPGFTAGRRYPVLYLLHGLPGSPSSYYSGLDFANAADAIVARTHRPFIAVIPAGGPVVNPDAGEWAGVWERFLVDDVVPWADRTLPTIATPQGRALGGLCAGGYGAMDIGLRNPQLFGTLESWEGYFAPVFRDGPFVHASRATLDANTPSLLVRRDAPALRSAGVRFYVSVGGNHGNVLRRWSLGFAHELAALGLTHRLWRLPPSERGHFWRATVPSALAYAADGFAHAS
ncbi:MAG TPA: alpha/beta hydrolase-fold protein [Gaiellaceae bacterium]|nr:alpha/beta hydrolase-fold protein [Gaiellaceae bacterium]